MQAEWRADRESEKNMILMKLLDDLCKTSDSEMPTKLCEQLNEILHNKDYGVRGGT